LKRAITALWEVVSARYRRASQMRYDQLEMVYRPIALEGAPVQSVRQNAHILGYLASQILRAGMRVSICVEVIAQVAAAQWFTGNKTFLVVCDQYTLKQSHCHPPSGFARLAAATG
jgi:hypothetical protein